MDVSSQLHALVILTLRKKNPVRIEWESVRAIMLIWMCWRREKSHVAAGNWTLIPQSASPLLCHYTN